MTDDARRVDYLWKKAFYRASTSEDKHAFEEFFKGIVPQVSAQDIWADGDQIPDPPSEIGGLTEYHSDLQLTEDLSVSSHRAHIAAETYGQPSTRLSNWIGERYGAGYLVQLYEDDGLGGLGPRVYARDPIDWVFSDFGVLICLNDPVAAGKVLPFHIRGYRYIGAFGAGTLGAADRHGEFTQPTPSNSWYIFHDLGKKPSVFVRGSNGPIEYQDVDYMDSVIELTITFSDPVSGTAYLN